MTKPVLAALICLVALLASARSWAGFTADLKMIQAKPGEKPYSMTGKYFLQGSKYRIDYQAEESRPATSGIFDPDAKVMIMLMHREKMYMKSALDMSKSEDKGMPELEVLRARGFDIKELGHEKLQGFDCTVYQIKDVKNENGMSGKVWYAKEFGMLPLKMEAAFKNGLKTSIALENVKKVDLAASTFSPPADYQEMPDMQKRMNEIRNSEAYKKLTPEQRKQLDEMSGTK